jgi:putative Holliday junction resolvase
MARILAIDYGTKRSGIAVTDPLKMIANPLTAVPTQELLPFLKEYIGKELVETIVVGEPKHMDGTASGPQEALANFVKAVEKTFKSIQVVRMDERFTSKMSLETMITAGATKKQRAVKENIDTISAVIILQSYMEQLEYRKR